jgi:cell fate (sporulation/competence/biofilm development) regulator YmcA (YheA/YmcA/DUF963 family)
LLEDKIRAQIEKNHKLERKIDELRQLQKERALNERGIN